MKTAITNLCTLVRCKLSQKLSTKEGISDFATVAIIIVIALVIGAVIFGPMIFKWFNEVIGPGLTQKTNEIFNYKSTP